MIFDIDHMSYSVRNEVLTIAESAKYPVISGHTGFVDVSQGDQANEGNLKAEEVERVRKLGGMVSVIIAPGDMNTIKTYRGEATPIVDHQCGATSQEFAQAYLYAIERMKGGPVGLGTDFNAGPIMPGPH
jgi:microsomal dipeptidase-like Zn-dependent dipeptidase